MNNSQTWGFLASIFASFASEYTGNPTAAMAFGAASQIAGGISAGAPKQSVLPMILASALAIVLHDQMPAGTAGITTAPAAAGQINVGGRNEQ